MERIRPTWDGERGWFSTSGESDLLGRIWARPEVTVPGPDGRPVTARARILAGEEAAFAAAQLARRHPLRHGLVVPLLERLRGSSPVHLELIPS